MPRWVVQVTALAGALAALGCGDAMTAATKIESVPTLERVSSEQWARLAERWIFFGHQSVGGNVLDGVQQVLAAHPQITLRVVETADPFRMTAPGLYHARIGTNGAPDSKLEAFKGVAGRVPESGTAILKYCYVDITGATDPDALFESYRRAVDSLKAQRPTLTMVHVTLPLTADRGLWFHLRTVVRGNTSDRQLNLTRQRYNELMRRTYGGREPLFDLAALESLGPDGRAVTVKYRGQDVPTLAPHWTSDGGHLNPAGQRRIAEAFLATLAGL